MKILYFAPIYFDDMKQRPQQIAELLAYQHTVYYIEPTVSLMRQVLKGGRTCLGKKDKVSDKLKIIRLNGVATLHKSLEKYDYIGLNNISEVLQIKRFVAECDVIWVGYSGWYTVVRHFKNKKMIFDKMDEEDMLVSSKMLQCVLKKSKEELAAKSDYVIVTCQKFYEEMKKYGKKTVLVPNAVSKDFAAYAKTSSITYKAILKIKRVGYVGTISEWFDFEILDTILKLDSEVEIILVGRNHLPEYKHPRVKYAGIKKNEELPEIIMTFDICLYNFKKIPLLDTINPVKIYEYLAMNVPVLAVKSLETEALQDYLMLYEKKEDIKMILNGAVKRPFMIEEQRLQFIQNNSWNSRLEQINKILESMEKE